ncbi:hypothetical protein KCTC52924_02974 [Arenibacter antarcticus]
MSVCSFSLLVQRKRTKRKDTLNNKFFRHQGRKTVFETPRRPFSGTPDFGAFAHYFAFKGIWLRRLLYSKTEFSFTPTLVC